MSDFFRLKEHGTDVRTEAVAGLTTFLTMAYIIVVNPQILAASGMDLGAVMVATCLAAAASTLVMGLWANVPIAQAPGMGLNAFFTFTVCGALHYPWQQALGIVFISGVLNILLTVTRVREMVVRAIPRSLKLSIAVGIGLFLALIGFKNMGVVVGNPETLVAFGKLSAPTTLLALAGLLLTAFLHARGVRAALLLGILGVTAAGVALGHAAPPAALLASPPSLAPTLLQLDILTPLREPRTWSIILGFMFVDLFDSVGTLLSVGSAARLVKEDGTFPQMVRSLQADAVATPIGALLGTSSTTSYIESAAGAESGGRTGLTAVFVAGLFLLGIFFSPLAAAIPPFATAPALVMVGFFMMAELRRIDFTSVEDGLPVFVTFVLMPFTYSISIGLGFGFLCHVIIKVALGKGREVHPILYPICAVFLLELSVR